MTPDKKNKKPILIVSMVEDVKGIGGSGYVVKKIRLFWINGLVKLKTGRSVQNYEKIFIFNPFCNDSCVFFCSCSQKTNDVKKTSSQHEKKLKSVPNNNTKEDVISEEDLEKGYDLPVSAQENEEATRDSMQIMSGLEHIYRNADKGDSLNVVLDNKSICKMIKKIKQQGYSVTVSEDYSNMENYKRFSSFLAKAQEKQKGSGVIYEVHSEGSIGRKIYL